MTAHMDLSAEFPLVFFQNVNNGLISNLNAALLASLSVNEYRSIVQVDIVGAQCTKL